MDVDAAERDLLDRLVGERRFEGIRPRDTSVPVPASHGQQQLWLAHQINPDSREYVVPEAVRLTGVLDPDTLRSAFTRLVQRHEILRTRFVLDEEGALFQIVDTTPRVPFDLWDLHGHGVESVDETVDEQLRDLAGKPFDLEHGPLIRVRLIRLAMDEYVLTMVIHHIVYDGWSFSVLMRELSFLYSEIRGIRTVGLKPLAVQYADFSAWQRSNAQGARTDSQLAFWRDYLAELEPVELPSDLPRPSLRSGRGEALYLPLPVRLSSQVTELSLELRVTRYMIYLAVYQMLLRQWTGREDIAVGTPVSGRNRAETENLIGYFVNTVVVRTDLSGDPPFVEYLGRVRSACLDSFSNQDVPFGRLVDVLRTGHDLSRTPLFQHAFVYNAGFRSDWAFPDLESEVLRAEMHIAKCDASISLSDTGRGGNVRIEYSTDLFHESTAEIIGYQYLGLLSSVLKRPHAALSKHGVWSRT